MVCIRRARGRCRTANLIVFNKSARERHLEFTSYSEVCLNGRRADRAHPAFAKLFIETEFDEATGALIARRRPREAKEIPLFAVHVSASSQNNGQPVEHETDRLRFLGRGRTAENPVALDAGARLSGTVGAVLDPIFALRRRVVLGPGETARLAFATGAADDREAVETIAGRFSDIDAVDAALSQASFNDRTERKDLKIANGKVPVFYRLAGNLVFSNPSLRIKTSRRRQLNRSALWSHGISGDVPILLARLDDKRSQAFLRELVAGHEFCSRRGLQFDLVLLDERGSIGATRLADKLQTAVAPERLGRPGGIHVLSSEAATKSDMAAISAAARVVMSASAGSLSDQLTPQGRSTAMPLPPLRGHEAAGQAQVAGKSLLYWNGFGGFSTDGLEYVTVVTGSGSRSPELPPAPWTNVIANPGFGCLTTESGLGYTWSGNSQMNRLTPWSNDPVSDAPGEVVYLRDEDTGEVWTPTPLPLGGDSVVTVRHGAGFTKYESIAGSWINP